jgi:hypothetical protein
MTAGDGEDGTENPIAVFGGFSRRKHKAHGRGGVS